MEFAFINKEIRSICENEDRAIEELGGDVAKALKNRLADLYAATSVLDLIVGNPEQYGNDSYRIELSNGYRLVFCASHVKIPYANDGNVDWTRVYRIKILDITNENSK